MSNKRYYPELRNLTLWESIKHWFRTTNWTRVELSYREVRKGEDGYEGAPFETTFNFVGSALIIEKHHYDEHDED